MIPRFTDAVYQHVGLTPSVLKILTTCTMVPVTIKKIIDAVGVLSHDDKVYLPVVAKTENNEGLIPRPENVMLSSLRETVEALSDAQTPLIQRQRFEANCPIPDCKSTHLKWWVEPVILRRLAELLCFFPMKWKHSVFQIDALART
ncbi:hypothetical protein JYU34_010053 [Plutella xylostella]|uniref:Uncharacterized protein n=1 Tax=Plutella xylostella TaxID=51655 RepID=A0ABQ7QHK3_PLUXY|nr:hypothetical protein JYU34_010053 [Plutella xylostella]